jgi:hypothetical protein
MMDVKSFVRALLTALADIEAVKQIALQTEGPIVNGRAHLNEEVFLAFYYNQITGTQAFALVRSKERIWGIDYDNIRGWHLHPLDSPNEHAGIEPQSVSSVIQQLKQVLEVLPQ